MEPRHKKIRPRIELRRSPSFRLHSADDASVDAGDLSALNVLVVQTDNSHSTSVTSVAAAPIQRCDGQRGARERSPLCNKKP